MGLCTSESKWQFLTFRLWFDTSRIRPTSHLRLSNVYQGRSASWNLLFLLDFCGISLDLGDFGLKLGLLSNCLLVHSQCHTDHDLLELNNKRHFRCDCGGSRFDCRFWSVLTLEGRETDPGLTVPAPCTLKEKEKDTETNPENNYGRNFKDEYCLCGEATKTGSESMFQCLVCEGGSSHRRGDQLHQAL